MKIRSVILAALLVVVLFVGLALWGPVGSDWFHYFDPIADRFRSGDTRLYDARSRGYFDAPWGMLLLVPLAALPIRAGQSALTILTLSALLAVTRAYTTHLFRATLALSTAFVVDHVLRGQLDALVLAGTLLGWWAVRERRPGGLSLALVVMAVKPINVVLAGLVLLIAVRRWSQREWLIVLSGPVAAVLLSALVIGFDWPLRYVRNLFATPPIVIFSVTTWTTLGPGTAVLGIWLVATLGQHVLQEGASSRLVALALALNLVLTPYANDSHYVLLIPAWLWLVEQRRAYLLLFPLTWLPLARVWGVAPEIIYPLLLTGGLLGDLSFVRPRAARTGDVALTVAPKGVGE